jgi:GT2 family glycosyltransferase
MRENVASMTTRTGQGTVYVIAPVHDRRAVTERFVRCLIDQTDQRFHLVLVDDGSRDGTADMVTALIPATTVIRGTGRWWWAGSLQQARRWLLRQPSSPGDIVLIANDDTTFEPDFLAKARSVMRRSGRALLLAEPHSAQSGRALSLGMRIEWPRLRFTPTWRLDEVDCFPTRGLFLHRVDFESLGGFHTVLLPHYLSDYEYTIRAARRGFAFRTDPAVRLVMDEATTGIRKSDYRSGWGYLRTNLTIKSSGNPIYWSTFVILAAPRHLALRKLVTVWRRFARGFLKAARTSPAPRG